jgi:hypothetical protein
VVNARSCRLNGTTPASPIRRLAVGDPPEDECGGVNHWSFGINKIFDPNGQWYPLPCQQAPTGGYLLPCAEFTVFLPVAMTLPR